jgi:hypothetical protein
MFLERICPEEEMVIELVRTLIKGELKDPEEFILDPDPKQSGYAREQYHIWYYPHFDTVHYRKFFEMIGWFFVDGRKVSMTFIKKLPWQEHYMGRPTNTTHAEFDIANPNPIEIKKLLRTGFNRAKKYLKEAAKRDE